MKKNSLSLQNVMFKTAGKMTADDVSSRCIEFIKGKLPEKTCNKYLQTKRSCFGEMRDNRSMCAWQKQVTASLLCHPPPSSSRSTIFRHTSAKDQEHIWTTLFLHRWRVGVWKVSNKFSSLFSFSLSLLDIVLLLCALPLAIALFWTLLLTLLLMPTP